MNVAARGLILAALLLAPMRPAEGQLLSPGPLSRAHESVEGLQRCTECHQLGKRGVSAERCLACHTPLATRLRAGSGYHASVPADACADCHQDHLGSDFALIRLDTASFDHRETGYLLTGGHAGADCRACHQGGLVADADVRARKSEHGALDRTFLGLARSCTTCHVDDDPHGEAFGARACAECHDTGVWEEPLDFDHAATGFRLEGKHRDASCAECHAGPVRRDRPPAPGGAALAGAECAGCHDTPHGSAMASTCGDCHDPAGWHVLRAGALDGGFDHARTDFALRGAHAAAECAACHQAGRPPRDERLYMTYRAGSALGSYPVPESATCASCHVNRHAAPPRGERQLSCAECHAELVWAPSTYGVAEHATSAAFPLDGAHLAVPCVACHVDPDERRIFPLDLGAPDCRACHETDRVHRESYADRACVSCHTTDDFAEVEFVHPPDSQASCVSCHGDADPHEGQFGEQRCSDCHGVETFSIPDFDHAVTRFDLDGAHAAVECRSCHLPDTSSGVVRYRPLGTECEDCHGGAP